MSAGILCANQVKELIDPESDTKRLYNASGGVFEEDYVGPSAIDLPLGGKYWEMEGSCRTGSEYKVLDLTQQYSKPPHQEKSLDNDPIQLKKKCVYLFEADCGLDLTDKLIQGKATGRSSIGRLDVLVRLLVNQSDKFDFVKKEKEHKLYIEVTPISFDVEVKKGTVLSQLRLFKGREQDISLTMEELSHEEDDDFPVVKENGELCKEPCRDQPGEIWFPFRLDLSPDSIAECSAFAAKKEPDDLPSIDPDKKHHYEPREFWDPIKAKDGFIELETDRLYIMRSKERLKIPGHLALECKSYTTQMGEWRIEYAGFAHPYFGWLRDDEKKGTPIIFEVRGHNVPTILTDGIPLGNVRFLRMSQRAEEPQKKSTYDEQELALSKCFKAWV